VDVADANSEGNVLLWVRGDRTIKPEHLYTIMLVDTTLDTTASAIWCNAQQGRERKLL
jgi:hypothetical protein